MYRVPPPRPTYHQTGAGVFAIARRVGKQLMRKKPNYKRIGGSASAGGRKLAATAVRRKAGLAIKRARTRVAQRRGYVNSAAGERQHLIGSGISSKPSGHRIQTIGQNAAKRIKVGGKKILTKKPKYQKIDGSSGTFANYRNSRAQMRGDAHVSGGRGTGGGGIGDRFDNALDQIQTAGDVVQTYGDIFRSRKTGSSGGGGEEVDNYDDDIIDKGLRCCFNTVR